MLSQESTRSEEEIRSETSHDRQRVNNLSCLELPAEGLDLLSKGPNYAITQEASDDIILEAKKGVERLAYAKRWQDCMRRKKESTRNTTDTITNDSTTTDNLQLPNPHGNTTTIEEAPETAVDTVTTPTETIPSERGAPDCEAAPSASGQLPNRATRNPSKSGLSFSFSDTDKKFPPPSDAGVKSRLKQLKEDIVKCYKNHAVTKSNVSQSQKHFLRELEKNEQVIIKQTAE